ncbi:hypothetical protein D3C75_756950 [compost metagenome]
MPVLSVQRISIAPKFWIASRCLTITFCFDSFTAPRASVEVTIIGSISGVKPTATESENSAASHQSPLVKPLISSTTGVITSMKRMSTQLTRLMPFWNAFGSLSCWVTRPASCPNQVLPPVEMIIASAVPLTTLVPIKHSVSHSSGLLCDRSRLTATFSTGKDSPVSEAWPTKRSRAWMTRKSAGIMSPAASLTMSPGTSWSSGISINSFSPLSWTTRSTVAVLLTIAFSVSAALVERAS